MCVQLGVHMSSGDGFVVPFHELLVFLATQDVVGTSRDEQG